VVAVAEFLTAGNIAGAAIPGLLALVVLAVKTAASSRA